MSHQPAVIPPLKLGGMRQPAAPPDVVSTARPATRQSFISGCEARSGAKTDRSHRSALREQSRNRPTTKQSTVPKPFRFATEERAKQSRATKPDDGFEVCASSLADIQAQREICSLEVDRPSQVRRHTDAYPRNSMIHERQSVRYSLAPFSETRQAIARFNDASESKPRPAKRDASPAEVKRASKQFRLSTSPGSMPMDAEEQTPLMVQRPGDSKLKIDANMGECKKEWMEQASRLSKEKLGLMEQLITANREKEEAVKELSQVRLQLQQKENENSELRTELLKLQSVAQVPDSASKATEGSPVAHRPSRDFTADDEYCSKMGISDDDSDEGVDDMLDPHWFQEGKLPQATLPTTEELLQQLRSGMETKFGIDGSRRAFQACGEQGGKITKQRFSETIETACDVSLSIRQKSVLWEDISKDGNLKNNALYFEAFSRVFFKQISAPVDV